MKVSIVIPTFNRSEMLSVCLEAVARNNVEEVIVVDDGSFAKEAIYDATAKVIEGTGLNIKLSRNKKNIGASASRKVGLSMATGDFIIFLDDDIVIPENYISTLKLYLNRYPGYGCYTGNISKISTIRDVTLCTPEPEKLLVEDRKKDTYSRFNFRISYKKLSELKAPSVVLFGWNPLIWKAEIVKNDIEFYEYVGNGYREETDPQIQINKKGGEILYLPGLVCFHYGEKNEGGQWGEGGIFKGLRWYLYAVKNNWIFLVRHGDFLRRKKYLLVSIYVSQIIFMLRNLRSIL